MTRINLVGSALLLFLATAEGFAALSEAEAERLTQAFSVVR